VNAIVIDAHPPKDVRIGRHISYLLEKGIKVYHLNFNFFLPRDEASGPFSDFGENGFRYNLFNQFRLHSGLKRMLKNACFLLGNDLAKLAIAGLKQTGLVGAGSIIIHVHDPVLLPMAARLIKGPFKNARLIYDRHELYEMGKSFHGINSSTIFERLSRDYVDGIAVVSDQHVLTTRKRFPGAQVLTIPNYPSIKDYDLEAIDAKIDLFSTESTINFNYIGSLDNAFDRDLDLMILIAECVLDEKLNVRFIFGGKADPALEQRLHEMAAKYPGKFLYPGYIPRTKTVKLTENAHLGFYLMRPDTCYWVKCSPNKIFEYLICGVVPLIRADVDKADEIKTCSLIFSRKDREEKIIQSILDLVNDPARLEQMMVHAKEISSQFTFETVADRYLKLYGSC